MIFKPNNNLIKTNTFNSFKYFKRFVQHFSQRPDLISDKCFHRLSLEVCQPLYAGDSSKDKWYLRSAPKSGLPMKVECVDTKPGDPNKVTIVALHGCPGSHLDFTRMVEHFGIEYRVIVPNFPDFSVTKATNHFWHSAKEKAQYIRDVLKALDVNRIDCLIAHSSALFPASYLWSKDEKLNDFNVKSVCLLSNPGPAWFRKKVTNRASKLIQLSRIPAIRNYFNQIWSLKLSKRFGIVNQIDRFDDLILLLCTYLHSDTETVEQRLRQLKELRIPTLSVFSSKDKLFDEEIFYSLYEILEVRYEDYDVYEEYYNHLVQKSSDDNWIKVVNIRSGGHYVFSTHAYIVNQYIEQLISKVTTLPRLQLNSGIN